MRVLQITATGSSEGRGPVKIAGFRAAGPVLLVTKKGPTWVASQDGTRLELEGTVAVFFETGEWVEYGHDGEHSELTFYGARESDIGFHPCGPLDASTGDPPSP
jgi:hypothetical protein